MLKRRDESAVLIVPTVWTTEGAANGLMKKMEIWYPDRKNLVSSLDHDRILEGRYSLMCEHCHFRPKQVVANVDSCSFSITRHLINSPTSLSRQGRIYLVHLDCRTNPSSSWGDVRSSKKDMSYFVAKPLTYFPVQVLGKGLVLNSYTIQS